LEFAKQAVQYDSDGTNPEEAVKAYGQAAVLLSEVMGYVGRSSSPWKSATSLNEELRQMQHFHDVYTERMNTLTTFYCIPAAPHS